MKKAAAHLRLRVVVAVGFTFGLATPPTWAAVPNVEKIADAVARTNRLAGRTVPVLLDLTLTIDPGEPVATGVLASHPTGLARLELKSGDGSVERHLLQGNTHTASQDGRELAYPRPVLPPMFFLQMASGAALQAALTSFGMAPGEVALGRVADRDCYVLGGRLPRGAAGQERKIPSLWVDMETFEILQIDRLDGVRFRFGPSISFEGIQGPSWIDVESPDQPTARLGVVRLAPANAPAAAFGEQWLSDPALP